ncbi:MAG: hypothetical protein KA817_06845 [Flavobacteriales bacterium]|nr:hypothetical protein [Flavobacteriales bacterium]
MKFLLGSFCVLLLTAPTLANNIQVANVSVSANVDSTAQVRFDLSWENSWKGGPTDNWDAAWVFVKFRSSITGLWSHAHLSGSNHVAPPDAQITPALLSLALPPDPWTPIPYAGAFIRRVSNGAGNVIYNGVELRWDHGGQGVAFADVAEVRVFAIEMVYVNAGTFAAGGSGTENGFTLTTINTPVANQPPTGVGSLGGQAGGYPTGAVTPVANWPNGFNAFYCMKYEVSQQGFVDHQNTLDPGQQFNSAAPSGTPLLSGASGWRNGMVVLQPGVPGVNPATYACDLNGNGIGGEPNDGGDLACVGLSREELWSYLDWAALRPMTELEFEKVCRGPLPPLANEFPWGSALVTNAGYGIVNQGAANENINSGYSTSQGNAVWSATLDTIGFPLRVGVFAAHPAVNSRAAAGAGYFGAMELAGNAGEHCVPLEYAGELFSDFYHGDGELDPDGHFNEYDWPNDYYLGSVLRGGHGESLIEELRLAERNYSILSFLPMGGRGVRSE